MCDVRKYYSDNERKENQITEDEMGGACRYKYMVGKETCIKFVRENDGKSIL
jgi:hypothetical protein